MMSLKTIAVVGSGVSLAGAASLLASQLVPHGVRVVAVDWREDVAGEELVTTGADIVPYLELIGLGEPSLVRACAGSYSLGIDWHAERRYFAPYAPLGLNPEAPGFHRAAVTFTESGSLDRLSLAACAARSGKFAVPGRDRPDLAALLAYGLNLHRSEYTDVLHHHGIRWGVVWHRCISASWQIDTSTPLRRRLILDSGEAIDADAWVDVSAAGRLSRLAPERRLPRATAWRENEVQWAPCRTLHSGPGVWHERAGSQRGTQHRLYADNAEILRDYIEQQGVESWHWQWRDAPLIGAGPSWREGCLHLSGEQLALPGPWFEVDALRRAVLVDFVDQVCGFEPSEPVAAHYNRRLTDYWNEACQFALAQWTLNTEEPLEKDLDAQRELFVRCAHVANAASDAVREYQWHILWHGAGYRPELTDVTLSKDPSNSVNQSLSRVADRIDKIVEGMPEHRVFVERLCSV